MSKTTTTDNGKKFSRADYMSGKCSHSEFYGQWVTDYTRQLVSEQFGNDLIKASKDEHFNDIPLRQWDRLASFVECYPDNSLSSRVCILKEAARQIRDS